jgi:hypothetical protein
VSLGSAWTPFAVTLSVPSIAGKVGGLNGDSSLGISFWTSAGSDFNAQSNSLGLQTIGVDLWGIHIKLGTHTVDAVNLYKQPELGPELARCQRYFYRVSAQVPAGSSFGITCPRKVTMRTTPTYFGGGSGFSAANNNAETAVLFQTTNATQVLSLDAEL